MASWLERYPFNRIRRFIQLIEHNGGLRGSWYKLYRMDVLKMGRFVGEDKYGNRYYESNYHFHGSNRWVEYSEKVHMDYDASQVPPEWHGWLHYNTDIPPTLKPPPQYKWMQDHEPNHTMTAKAYVPYSTTRPKIQAWVPPGVKKPPGISAK